MATATKKHKRSFFSFLNSTPKQIADEIKSRNKGKEPAKARTTQPDVCLLCGNKILKNQMYLPASSVRAAHLECVEEGSAGKISAKAEKPKSVKQETTVEVNGSHAAVEETEGVEVTDATLNHRLGALEREVAIWKELYFLEREKYESLLKIK